MAKKSLDDAYAMAREFEADGNDKKYLELISDLAEKGHHMSQFELAEIYIGGFCSVDQNYDIALKWHLKAEVLGMAESFLCLGMLYEPKFDGPSKTFSSDDVKSKKYYSKALQGFKERANVGDVQAIYRVSEMYAIGMGVDKDDKQAKAWFEKYNKSKG